MKPYTITYTGWLNFLIWFSPNQSLQKSVELNIKKGFTDFKSDKYEGVAREVNPLLLFSIRYSLSLACVFLLMPEIFHDNVLWLFTMLISINIGFHLVWLKNKITLTRLLSLLGFATIIGVMYWYLNPEKFYMMALSVFQPTTFFFLVFAMIDDFFKIKNAKFYSLKEVRILFYTSTKGEKNDYAKFDK